MDGTPSADLSMLQCASYALEMLSHGGLRSHVIRALVTDDTIQTFILRPFHHYRIAAG